MHYTILFRHGAYEKDALGYPLGLSDAGCEQVSATTELLKPLVCDAERVLLYSSPEQRALESAEIVSKACNLPLFVEKFLACLSVEELAKVLPFILSKNDETDVLIVVGHEDLKVVPPLLSSRVWKRTPSNLPSLEKGTALVIDWSTRRYYPLP